MCVCACVVPQWRCHSMWGLWIRRPLGEPSLAGLISVSHLSREALEELRVSKRREERETALLWNYQYLKRSNVVLIVRLRMTIGAEGGCGCGGFLKYVSDHNRDSMRETGSALFGAFVCSTTIRRPGQNRPEWETWTWSLSVIIQWLTAWWSSKVDKRKEAFLTAFPQNVFGFLPPKNTGVQYCIIWHWSDTMQI